MEGGGEGVGGVEGGGVDIVRGKQEKVGNDSAILRLFTPFSTVRF